MKKQLVSFDWAIKKLLRQKSNYAILEGFLSELLGFDVVIKSLLESEANQQDEYDKYNRVDILAEAQNGELLLVEVQNNAEVDFFQRMLFGVSKLITEYINKGETYGTIKKIYSVSIVYFELGQGKDYIYEYKGNFIGRQLGDTLRPTNHQKEKFKIETVADIFPKYFVLKIKNFNNVAKNTLDEWFYFLKNSQIQTGFKAKGLKAAAEKLDYEKLTRKEKLMYNRFQENRMVEKSEKETLIMEIEEEALKKGIEQGVKQGIEQGEYRKTLEVARKLIELGMDNALIAQTTNLSDEQIEDLRQGKINS
jgi:hypothetical protein